MSSNSPSTLSEHPFILFAQHGWADTAQDINYLARSLASSDNISGAIIYAPNLGWINTWLTIASLIDRVEKIAVEAIAKYPDLPWRIVGHSMGGLIWLEVLHRHPEWWHRVHSLALIGSPVGGSDLGRLFDPFGWFPLIARDLGTNRRPIAEAIAAQIPTISIMSDIGNYTDGTVPVGCSQFAYATIVHLERLHHATLKNHPQVLSSLRQFWANPTIAPIATDTVSQLIAKLRSLDLTETHNQNFEKARLIQTSPDDTKLWIWKNSLQITHVFVSIGDRCVYSAYTGWRDQYKLAIFFQK